MSSDDDEEEEFYDNDHTTDFEMTTDEEDNDDDDDDYTSQPIHFRECLRLLDSVLTSTNPSMILPRWCSSEQIGTIDDPMLLINGTNQYLSLPLNKREAKKFIHYAQPLDMKIDIIDGVSFLPTAYQIPPDGFNILNHRWKSKVEPYLKETCVCQTLQLNSNEIELKISNLILLKPCQFPRQFQWTNTNNENSSIAKLFINLPSFYHGGKEIIKYYKEKHVFDLTEFDTTQTSFYTIVPTSEQCKHEIDFISNGYKCILIYDIIPLTSTVYYNVNINPSIVNRVSTILDKWLNGLENDYHGYSTKIIIPFSETFTCETNPLLSGIDRIIGTILRQTIEDKFLLYQGLIQPNHSNDGTAHVCRLLTQMNLMNKNQKLFQKIDLCLANCNETYSGNIFLRKTRSEQGNLISIEQFTVPIWCIIPMNYKYDLLIHNLPHILNDILSNSNDDDDDEFLNWLLTTPKKINFNTKYLLHKILHHDNKNLILKKLFHHKKFLEQFFPINTKQEYDDIIYLLQDSQIQLEFHEIFRIILQYHSNDIDKLKDAIQFIGILSKRNIDSNFILVLIHELLSNIFQPLNPIPSVSDLTYLLSLLSLTGDKNYQISCEILSQQIIRQIKITTNSITNLLRVVLIPTLIQIYRQFQTYGKRKYDENVQVPSWFLLLYETCISLLNSYCDSLPSIPIYDKKINQNCCLICQELNEFFQNNKILEKTFSISHENLLHFYTIVKKFNPLIIQTKSMTSDNIYHQINLIKMSNYDQDIYRENHLLRSLLLTNQSHINSRKRFKSSF